MCDEITPVLSWQPAVTERAAGNRTGIIPPHSARRPLPRPVTRFTYDAVGNQTSVIDPLGNTTTSDYDALDRRTTVTDARGFSTTTAYDSVGNTTSVTDASGNVTLYAYDRLNRLVTETDPLQAVTRKGQA